MKIVRPKQKPKQESTIALINIVFLMLIFFLVAGTLAPPMDPDLSLVQRKTSDPAPPPTALSIRSNGDLFFRGSATSIEGFLSRYRNATKSIQIAPDQRAPAETLLNVITQLQLGTSAPVRVITQKVRP